jgi:general L-amino acid transport system permease protein
MTVYVEGFRNIPLLLWILVIFAVMTESTPQPRDFRGDDASASMILFDSVAVTNRGIYRARSGLGAEFRHPDRRLPSSLVAIWAFRRYAHKRQEQTGDILPVFWVSLGLFFVPSILCYFILGRPVSLDYPELGGFNFTGGIQLRNSLIALGSRCRSIPAPSSPRSSARVSWPSPRARRRPPMRWACAPTGR